LLNFLLRQEEALKDLGGSGSPPPRFKIIGNEVFLCLDHSASSVGPSFSEGLLKDDFDKKSRFSISCVRGMTFGR
jgi:hypothetical protein